MILNSFPQTSNGGITLFEILSSRLPPKDEISTIFELLLDDLNFRGEKRTELNNISFNDKWAVVSQHLLETFKRISDPWSKNDLEEIEKLKGIITIEDLECLEVLLRTRPISWMGMFIDNDGLSYLVSGLENSRRSDKRSHEEMYIRCLKSLMNNKIGLEAVFEFKEYLRSITQSLWSPSKRTVILVLEILGAVCLIPGGRSNVLESLECLSLEMNTRSRFDVILRIIGNELLVAGSSTAELLVACMSFINVMVSCGLEDNLGLRMYLRSEFEENGITRLIKRMSQINNELLAKQIDIWDISSSSDRSCAFSGLRPKDIDKVKNIDEILVELRTVMSKLGYESLLYKVLRNMVLLLGNKRGKELAHIIAMLADSVVSKPEIWLSVEDPLNSVEGSNTLTKGSVLKKNMELEATLHAEMEKNRCLEERNAKLSKEINELNVRVASMDVGSHTTMPKPRLELPSGLAMEIAKGRKPAQKPVLKTALSKSTTPDEAGSGPPPPPPPFLQGSGPPPPPPPPPPLGGNGVLPLMSQPPPPKTVPKSEKKLKPVNWVKIPANKAKTTVWSDVDDTEIHEKLKGSFYKVIEKAFQVSEAKTAVTASNTKLASKKITLLDTRRSQNCSIMLKSIKIPPAELAKIVEAGSFNKLSRGALFELMKYIPTKEEIDVMKQHENEIMDLAEPDRLLWELSRVPYCKHRIDAMILRKSFSESCDYIESTSETLTKACAEIRESVKLKEVLRVALALGNYLNSHSRGAAYGFKIGGLLKFGDVRTQGFGKKSTLLHFFAELLNENFPEIADFHKGIVHVTEASNVQISQAVSMLESLKEGTNKLNKLIANLSNASCSTASACEIDSIEEERTVRSDDECEFVKRMSPFHAMVESRMVTLESNLDNALTSLRSLATHYAEDPKITPSEFFGVFSTFLNMYRSAVADLLLAKEGEKKEGDGDSKKFMSSKKDAAANDAKDGRHNERRACVASDARKSNDQQLEDLISSIRTGKAFRI